MRCAKAAHTEAPGMNVPSGLDACTVLVTRPASEAATWVAVLQASGVHACAMPLIDIAALADTSDLIRAWENLHQQLAVMFVSANAVRHFMAARPVGVSRPEIQAWCTGPGTRAALEEALWPSDLIRSPDASCGQFDSEALWAIVLPQAEQAVRSGSSQKVLIVRGADARGQVSGRDWLAQQMLALGLEVSQCAAYIRQPPHWTPAQLAQARKALCDGCWWLFSSSEAAVHLQQALPDVPLARARALATHPRIAERLRQSGWGRVVLVPAALPEQAESIKSLA